MLWTLVLMYGYSSPSLRSLLCFPTWSPTTPLGASQTYSYPRVLCHPSGAPGAPPALPECVPSSLCSSFHEGASSAAGSARLGLRQSCPPCFSSLRRSWGRSFFVGSGIRHFPQWYALKSLCGEQCVDLDGVRTI